MSELEIHINHKLPRNVNDWNNLCEKCSNFFQSTMYDEVNSIYKNTPVFIEARFENKLVGGLKIYTYHSQKPLLKQISRQANSLGESVLDKNFNDNERILGLLAQSLICYLKEHKYNFYKSKGVYGGLTAEVTNEQFLTSTVSMAVLDLTLSEEDLWNGIYKTHRRYIKKAQKEGLQFVVEDNFEKFHQLLLETYSGQIIQPPSKKYLSTLYAVGKNYKTTELCFVKNGTEYLSTVMVIKFGNKVEYMHGGIKRNMLGSGQYIHWMMMNRYKSMGMQRAGFGLVEQIKDKTTKLETVSDFKMKFGCKKTPAINSSIVINSIKYSLWIKLNNTIQKITKN